MAEIYTWAGSPARSPAGWPARPVGGSDACNEIATFLYPQASGRSLVDEISSSSDAYRRVYALACHLLEDLRAQERSLHLAAERDRLKDIVAACETLRSKLGSYAGPSGHLQQVALACEFFTVNLDQHGISHRPVSASEILGRPLEELIERSHSALSELDQIKDIGRDRDKIFTRIYGEPRKTLAIRCAALLLVAQGPKAAPIKDGGPVADFATRVWTFATGSAPDFDFDRVAKEGARIARQQGYPPSLSRGGKQAKKLSLLP